MKPARSFINQNLTLMKKYLLLVTLVFYPFIFSQSQDPCDIGEIRINSQAEIDQFIQNYQDCTDLHGVLMIRGNDITNLNSLDNIASLTGLHIGYFGEGCPNLIDLTGLENLKSLGSLSLGDNQNLTSLNGLDNLESLGALTVYRNPSLENISALNNATISNAPISFTDNGSLTSLTGLEGLDTAYCICISGNSSLQSLSGLIGLVVMKAQACWGPGLVIQDNDALTDLSGLDNLKATGCCDIKGAINILDNDALVSLNGIQNIMPSTIKSLEIINNPQLSTCHVQSTCDYLATSAWEVIIGDNGPGCDTEEEVLENCISGTGEIADALQCQVFPNPVYDQATFKYTIEEPCLVTLTVLNSSGQLMEKLVRPYKKPGEHKMTWCAEGMPDGIYFYTLQAGDKQFIGKLLIIR